MFGLGRLRRPRCGLAAAVHRMVAAFVLALSVWSTVLPQALIPFAKNARTHSCHADLLRGGRITERSDGSISRLLALLALRAKPCANKGTDAKKCHDSNRLRF